MTILLLNLMSASLHDNYDVLEQVGSSLNSCIVSACVMVYCQKESEDNIESKHLLSQKKSMLREILRLFPAGIIFYSDKEGVFYENKFWIDMIDKFKISKFQFWKSNQAPTSYDSINRRLQKSSDFISNNNRKVISDTKTILGSLYHRDNTEVTLKEEIMKIYDYFSKKVMSTNQIED